MRVLVPAVCQCATVRSVSSGGSSAVNIMLYVQSQTLKQINHFIYGKIAIIWFVIILLDGLALLAKCHAVSLNTKEQLISVRHTEERTY